MVAASFTTPMSLQERKIEGRVNHQIWFDFTSPKGRKYSIVDLGKMMEPIMAEAAKDANTKEMYAAIFTGWEAMEVVEDDKLSGEQIRAHCWKELEKEIEIYEQETTHKTS